MCRQQRYIRAACAPVRRERPGGGTPLAAVERAVTFAAAAAASPGSAVDGLDDSGPVALADGDGRSGPAALSGVGGGTDPESRGAVKGGGDGVRCRLGKEDRTRRLGAGVPGPGVKPGDDGFRAGTGSVWVWLSCSRRAAHSPFSGVRT